MTHSRDRAQYGNQKKVSIQHYLIKLLHKVLTSLDENSVEKSIAVVLQMIDWSQAFDRQSHIIGVRSFIDNGVRPSLKGETWLLGLIFKACFLSSAKVI